MHIGEDRKYVIGSSLVDKDLKLKTEDLIVRYDGPEKLDIEIKSDWLLICFTFVTKNHSRHTLSQYSKEGKKHVKNSSSFVISLNYSMELIFFLP